MRGGVDRIRVKPLERAATTALVAKQVFSASAQIQ